MSVRRLVCAALCLALPAACASPSPAPARSVPQAPSNPADPSSPARVRAIPALDPVDNPHARSADQSDDPDGVDTRIYKVPVGSSPVSGPATAPITIVIFSDFQCPYCKDQAKTLSDVQKEFGSKVRLVFKHQPLPPRFHPRAEPAAQLAIEARSQKGDAAFWKAHDALFSSSPRLEDADLAEVARAIGLDPGAASRAVSSHKHNASLEEDQLLGDRVGVRATPTVFINGFKFEGAQPIEFFRAIIPAVMPIAEAIARQGVPPERVYEELIRDGVSAGK